MCAAVRENPYLLHPIAVAKIVIEEIGLGVKSVVASLLHDVVEDTEYTVEDMERIFGPKIASMVDGLTKMSGVFNADTSEQAEYFRKVLLTLSDDVRVILIKIADRLHNMRTLGAMPLNKQIKITSETIYLFAPLAYRLGLFAIKTELEDLCMKYRFPEQYEEISRKLDETEASRQEFIARFNAPIVEALRHDGINFEISARVKSIYSIWMKMQRKQIPFEEVYDLFAIRIVFKPLPFPSEKTQCYQIYATITDIYTPKPDRLRDWINTPKANGYEALHSTVMSPDGVWVEVQIRTQRMDDIAERGVAAHWKYKQETISQNEDELDKWLKRSAMRSTRRRKTPSTFWITSSCRSTPPKSSSSHRKASLAGCPSAPRRSISPTTSTPTSATRRSARRSTISSNPSRRRFRAAIRSRSSRPTTHVPKPNGSTW